MSQQGRISIVGATGSGKTFVARALARQLDLPLYQLDSLYWDSAGRAVPREQFREAVAEVVSHDSWIVDGHYRDVRDLIWRRADTIVWLNYPLAVVGLRLVRRYTSKILKVSAGGSHDSGTSRTRTVSSAAKVTWKDRAARIARTMRERKEYGIVLTSPEYRDIKIVELRSKRATREWLNSLGQP